MPRVDENQPPSALVPEALSLAALYPSRLKGLHFVKKTKDMLPARRSGLSEQSNDPTNVVRTINTEAQKQRENTAARKVTSDSSGAATVEKLLAKSEPTKVESAPLKVSKKTASATGEKRARAEHAVTTALAMQAKRGAMVEIASRAGRAALRAGKGLPTKSTDRPYVCIIKMPWGCERAFALDQNRQRHMDIHFDLHGDSDHKDKIKGVAFGYDCPEPGCVHRSARPDNLKRHTECPRHETCLLPAGAVNNLKQAWETEKGCKYLRLPPVSDPLRKRVMELWDEHGSPANVDD